MNTSDAGLSLIFRFEGKLKKRPDGTYEAYRCPAGVPTIYVGCTEGVTMGMVVTEKQGEEMFRRELVKIEKGVMLACTREPNQHQFDAFVALAYNIGVGAFSKSTVVRQFNAGNDEKAAAAFDLFNTAKVDGKRTVLNGLVRRRKAEAALFLRPTEPPEMPQKIEPPGMSSNQKTAIASTSVLGGGATVGLLSDPQPALDAASKAATAANNLPTVALVVVILVAGVLAAYYLYKRSA